MSTCQIMLNLVHPSQRYCDFSILEIANFYWVTRFSGLRHITVPNLVKIGKSVASSTYMSSWPVSSEIRRNPSTCCCSYRDYVWRDDACLEQFTTGWTTLSRLVSWRLCTEFVVYECRYWSPRLRRVVCVLWRWATSCLRRAQSPATLVDGYFMTDTDTDIHYLYVFCKCTPPWLPLWPAVLCSVFLLWVQSVTRLAGLVVSRRNTCPLNIINLGH